jgi:hypothetical protein
MLLTRSWERDGFIHPWSGRKPDDSKKSFRWEEFFPSMQENRGFATYEQGSKPAARICCKQRSTNDRTFAALERDSRSPSQPFV